MADNRRAGERTIFRGDVEGNDTLAEISRALETERRAPMAVGAGFVPPAGGQASNIPVMADLEDELLREFALYEGPRETTPRDPVRKIEPSFAPVSRPAAAPAQFAASASFEDDDDTMPPVDAGSLFRATAPAPIVRTHSTSQPAVSPSRIEPNPPAVFAPEPEADLDNSPAASDVSATDGEALDAVAFHGPDPDLADWDLDDVVTEAGPVDEPAVDAAEDVGGDAFATDAEPVFAGPVPDVEFGEEPVFAGPVPEIELDDEPAALGDEPVFAGLVPDFDFTDDDLSVAADAGEPAMHLELEGELEQSLGALDLAPDVAAEPSSPFAAWKNDRLAAVETTTPAWLSSAVIVPKPVPLVEDGSEAAAAVVPNVRYDGALTSGDVHPVEIEAPAEIQAETDPIGELEFELNEDDLVTPDFTSQDDAVIGDVGASDVDNEVAPVDRVEEIVPAAYLSVEPELSSSVAGSQLLAETPAAAAPSVAVDPVFEMPDWLQSARGLQAPLEPIAEKNVDFDFKDFEFDFDEDAIEAEVSRAVMSEFQANTAPQPSDEPPFDPTAITEIEDRMPASFGNIHVPQVPDQEGETLPKPVSDFDYDIEAEMAELFAMGNKSRAQTEHVEAANDVASSEAAEADGLTNELIRSIHEAPAVPAGRAFDMAEINAASTSFVSRYARVAAFAAIVAFAGFGAVILWRSGEVKNVVGEGAPRVIMADKTPVKEVPDDPGGKQVPNQDKAVYDRVSGKAPEVVKQGSLITNAEEPVNVAAKTLGDEGASPSDAQAQIAPDAVAASDTDARLPASPAQPGSEAQKLNDSVAPRKVKTMIVLPNGTLVARETNAPAELAATQKPSAADAAMTAPAASAKVEASQPAATMAPANGVAADGAPLAQGSSQQSADKNGLPAPASMPIPTARPAEQPVNVVGTVTQRGNVVAQQSEAPAVQAPTAKSAQQSAVASNVPAGTYVIQIASLPSEAEAQKSYANLSAKFASVIGGKSSDIKPAEIPGKGTYYRLRIVAGSKEDAIALCSRYKAAGGSCLVSR